MLTDPKLRSQVDQLWNKLWTGGLTNPLDAIEQFSYLLFLKRWTTRRTAARSRPSAAAKPSRRAFRPRCAGRTGRNMEAAKALKHVREVVFPWLTELGEQGSSFERYMGNAEFKINKPNLLIEACKSIDQMQMSSQNQDVQGDLYEYLLSKLNTAGRNGQFRTPRHIIRMMVQMIDPKPDERVGDLAAGTCGFRRQRLPARPRTAHLARHSGVRRARLAPQPGGRPAHARPAATFCRRRLLPRLRQRLRHDHAAHRLDEPDAARHRQPPLLLHGHPVQGLRREQRTTT